MKPKQSTTTAPGTEPSNAAGQLIFQTTRFKRGNFLFPAVIEITDTEVIRIKKYWFLKFRKRINFSDIVSLHIRNFQFSSELVLKRHNGKAPLMLIGIQKSEVHRIRQLVEKKLGPCIG